MRDPRNPATLYAGFSITPNDGLWRNAADGRTRLGQLDPIDLAGGMAFILLLALAAGAALRRLARYYGPAPDAYHSSGGELAITPPIDQLAEVIVAPTCRSPLSKEATQ